MGTCQSAPILQIQACDAPKIIGIGLNYLKQRMQGPLSPIIFLKSWSSIAYNPKQLHLPLIQQSMLIHELQFGVMIGQSAYKVRKQNAMGHVAGYFIAIDITDTSMGKPGDYVPETLIKSQQNFCPVSPLVNEDIDPYEIELEYRANGQAKQKDSTKNMHFKIDSIIEYISQYMTLNRGDLILTGTPSGAGPMKEGDRVECFARFRKNVVAEMSFTITK